MAVLCLACWLPVSHGYCEMEFIFGRLSVVLAGKRSVPQSVFIHVNISTFTNKIARVLIEVKHQAARILQEGEDRRHMLVVKYYS